MDDANFKGFAKLDEKLRRLGSDVGGKALRRALGYALTPGLREIRRSAPVGKLGHKTYKGRLVAPGFLSRSVKKVVFLSKDKQTAVGLIGVQQEAFYGVLFLHQGTVYIDANEWMADAFERSLDAMVNRLKEGLHREIEKVARR